MNSAQFNTAESSQKFEFVQRKKRERNQWKEKFIKRKIKRKFKCVCAQRLQSKQQHQRGGNYTRKLEKVRKRSRYCYGSKVSLTYIYMCAHISSFRSCTPFLFLNTRCSTLQELRARFNNNEYQEVVTLHCDCL